MAWHWGGAVKKAELTGKKRERWDQKAGGRTLEKTDGHTIERERLNCTPM